MTIAALITKGIGPGGTVPFLLTGGLKIGAPVTTTFDSGGIGRRRDRERRKRELAGIIPQIMQAGPSALIQPSVKQKPIDDDEEYEIELLLLSS